LIGLYAPLSIELVSKETERGGLIFGTIPSGYTGR